jgi:hypothetical protein
MRQLRTQAGHHILDSGILSYYMKSVLESRFGKKCFNFADLAEMETSRWNQHSKKDIPE